MLYDIIGRLDQPRITSMVVVLKQHPRLKPAGDLSQHQAKFNTMFEALAPLQAVLEEFKIRVGN